METKLNRGALVAILLCVLIAAVDHSIIATALPVIGRDLHIAQSGLQWITDSYTIAFASGLFVAGRLADRFGRKRMLVIGLLFFLAATIYTGIARDTLQLVIGRALMGVGGTLLLPSTLAIISSQAAPQRRTQAISLWSATFGMGIALGPLVGGWLLGMYHWSSIFWVNVPFLVLAIGLVAALLPSVKSESNQRVQLGDGILSAVGISLCMAAIIEAPVWGFTNISVIAFLLGGLLTLAVFAFRQLRIKDPLLDIRIFRSRPVAIATLIITLLFAAFSGALFLVAQFAELVLQFSALRAGVAFVPLAFGLLLGSLWSSILQMNHGVKVALTVGTTVATIGTGLLALFLKVDASLWTVSVLMGIAAVGLGAAFAASTSTITSGLPKNQAGVASALNDATRELGGALGVAVIGSIANWQYGRAIRDTLHSYTNTPIYAPIQGGLATIRAAQADIPKPAVTHAVAAFVSGSRVALLVSAATIAVLIILVRKLLPYIPIKHESDNTTKRWFAH